MLIESLIIGRIIGVFLIVCALLAIFKTKEWIKIVDQISKKPEYFNFIALFELLAGLIIVSFHSVWVFNWTIIITIIGWLMVFESILYVFVPYRLISESIRLINNPKWYKACGMLSLLLGLFLCFMTFLA